MANKSKKECMESLKICTTNDENECKECDICPYGIYAIGEKEYKGTNCDEELMKDALEYLKETYL